MVCSDNVPIISLMMLGNADGIGDIREKELYRAGSILGIQSNDIYLINHPRLQDGMTAVWSIDLVSEIVLGHVRKLNPEVVCTESFL
jgi:N-acetylglucosaminylphosphatidylinositol deacetylase